ncbi:MAG: DUF4249 domain-containing protein [Bacteroidales bacterium]|nr:MAG: DUF4249 domain-containing protein [Bacteroidales bacterium]
MKRILFKKYLVILSMVSVCALTSCTEKMDDYPLENSETRCVIVGKITTETIAHKVMITRSAPYFNDKPLEPISGAIVTISDGTDTFSLIESTTELGSYFTNPDVFGIPGRTYTLNISNVNLLGDGVMESYTAMSELKPVTPLDSIDTRYNNRFHFWETIAWAKEPQETEDYYMFRAYIDNVLNSDSLLNYGITEDKFFNGSDIIGKLVYMFPEKDTIKLGKTIVTIDICGITKDYFLFLTEAQTMARPQNPMFSGPPANIRTNISNGAVGYFSAFSVASCSRKVKSQE